MAHILVVDDEAHVVHLLSRVLGELGHAVVAAYDGKQAIELLQESKPDLVILDVSMPGIDGLQLCRYIRASPRLAPVPVLMISAKGQPEDRVAGLEAGADDSLDKPFHPLELALRVKALLRRAAQSPPHSVWIVGPLHIDRDNRRASFHGRPLELTPTEFELLSYLALHAGEVLSAERLLQEVWAYRPGVANTSLVRMHVLNLRRKLEKDPTRPTYLRTVPRHGYTLCVAEGASP